MISSLIHSLIHSHIIYLFDQQVSVKSLFFARHQTDNLYVMQIHYFQCSILQIATKASKPWTLTGNPGRPTLPGDPGLPLMPASPRSPAKQWIIKYSFNTSSEQPRQCGIWRKQGVFFWGKKDNFYLKTCSARREWDLITGIRENVKKQELLKIFSFLKFLSL